MLFASLWAFFTFAVIASFTPGPNNILMLNTGMRYGLRKSVRLLAGIWLGILCLALLCGSVLFFLKGISPTVLVGLKYVGCAYIVWLAWLVGRPAGQSPERSPQTRFLTGFVLQFVNVKNFIYCITAYTGFIFPASPSVTGLVCGAVVLSLFGSAGTIAWGAAGAALQQFLHRHAKITNITMTILLLACAVHILLQPAIE